MTNNNDIWFTAPSIRQVLRDYVVSIVTATCRTDPYRNIDPITLEVEVKGRGRVLSMLGGKSSRLLPNSFNHKGTPARTSSIEIKKMEEDNKEVGEMRG